MAQLQSQPIPQPQVQQDPVALLDAILAKSTESQKTKLINDSLTKRIETIRELLPEHLKPSAERFVKRAALYFAQRPKLQECTPASFVMCVLSAAELGLAIDGSLAHAVPYSNKKKDANGRDRWEKEAKLIVDYKGIVAVCRRNKTIFDTYARIVCENDQYDAWEEDGACRLIHRVHVNNPRGECIGAYAKVILPHGIWRFEWMDVGELNKIRARSRSKDSGPWVTDTWEMFRKTALKRCLKTYLDDPDINRLLEVDSDYEVSETSGSNGQKDTPSIDDILKAREQPVKPEVSTAEETNDDGDEEENGHE